MKYFSSAELATHDFEMPEFLVEPCIPSGGDVLLHGKRGAGKTQYALTMAMDILCQRKHLGVYDTRSTPVVFIELDMPEWLFQSRVKRLPTHPNLHYFITDSRIDIQLDVATNAGWIKKLRSLDPGLVVIDTLRKCHKLDEQDSNTPVAIYGAWRDATGSRSTNMFLHHDRKSYEGENRDESARGSGAWLDEVDTAIHLRTKAKRLDRMVFTKLRTMDYPDDIKLRLNPDSLLVEVDEQPEVERELQRMMLAGRSRDDILDTVTDVRLFPKGAMTKRTAERRLEGYVVGSKKVALK